MIMGCVSYPLTEQIKDTVAAHGWHWAHQYYVKEQRIPFWMWTVLTDAAVKYLRPAPRWVAFMPADAQVKMAY